MPQNQKTNDTVKILVVDDEELALEEFVFMLRAAGLNAVGVNNAAQGLESFLRDISIGVVISDIRMPTQDGIGLLQSIRRCGDRGATCAFILVTGFPEVANAIAAIDLRVEKYLLKPIMPDEALTAASAAISSYRKAVSAAKTNELAVSTLCAVLDGAPPAVVLPRIAKDSLSGVDPKERYRAQTAMLQRMLRSLKLRSKLLPQEISGDPAWTMLLELALLERSNQRVSVTGLTNLAQTSYTTALRRIQDMVEANLFVRYEDATDKRRGYIVLSKNARDQLDQLLDLMLEDPSS